MIHTVCPWRLERIRELALHLKSISQTNKSFFSKAQTNTSKPAQQQQTKWPKTWSTIITKKKPNKHKCKQVRSIRDANIKRYFTCPNTSRWNNIFFYVSLIIFWHIKYLLEYWIFWKFSHYWGSTSFKIDESRQLTNALAPWLVSIHWFCFDLLNSKANETEECMTRKE